MRERYRQGEREKYKQGESVARDWWREVKGRERWTERKTDKYTRTVFLERKNKRTQDRQSERERENEKDSRRNREGEETWREM